jgi:hypothetical protein
MITEAMSNEEYLKLLDAAFNGSMLEKLSIAQLAVTLKFELPEDIAKLLVQDLSIADKRYWAPMTFMLPDSVVKLLLQDRDKDVARITGFFAGQGRIDRLLKESVSQREYLKMLDIIHSGHPEQRRWLAQDATLDIDWWAASRKLPDDIALALAQDEDDSVRAWMARRAGSLPDSVVKLLLRDKKGLVAAIAGDSLGSHRRDKLLHELKTDTQ